MRARTPDTEPSAFSPWREQPPARTEAVERGENLAGPAQVEQAVGKRIPNLRQRAAQDRLGIGRAAPRVAGEADIGLHGDRVTAALAHQHAVAAMDPAPFVECALVVASLQVQRGQHVGGRQGHAVLSAELGAQSLGRAGRRSGARQPGRLERGGPPGQGGPGKDPDRQCGATTPTSTRRRAARQRSTSARRARTRPAQTAAVRPWKPFGTA